MHRCQCQNHSHILQRFLKVVKFFCFFGFFHLKFPCCVLLQNHGRVFYPIGYGADPTGVQDSTDAIFAAIRDAGTLQNGLDLLPGITDLGGIVIDFQGGNFRISHSIRFPPGIGNLVVRFFLKFYARDA